MPRRNVLLCKKAFPKNLTIFTSVFLSFFLRCSKIKTFLHFPGHLRFMCGCLSSVAPSFSNHEPRAHKLRPEFLPTIQGGMKREGWSLFEPVSSCQPEKKKKKSRGSLGGTWRRLSLTPGPGLSSLSNGGASCRGFILPVRSARPHL